MRNLVLAVLLIVQFSGCGSDGGGSSENDISQFKDRNIKYWGEWRSFQTGETKYITTKDDIAITEVEDNIIQIDSDYYIRLGSRNVNFSGEIYKEQEQARATKGYESIGGIDIILQNIIDPNIKAEVSSDEKGDFYDNSLPTGDYNLKVERENQFVESEVSLVREDEDIGAFKLVPKGLANFKIEFESEAEFFYADKDIYKGFIKITNIGNSIAKGLNFISKIDGSNTFKDKPVLGSVKVKEFKKIPIEFSFPKQNGTIKQYILNVDIRDAENRAWREHINLNAYKRSFALHIKSEKRIKGSLKFPNWKSISLDTKDIILNLPVLEDEKFYTLLFTNYGDIDAETIYGIGINRDVKDFSKFRDTGIFEPNNNLADSTILKIGDSKISYLHIDDVDYFKLTMENGIAQFNTALFNINRWE